MYVLVLCAAVIGLTRLMIDFELSYTHFPENNSQRMIPPSAP